MLTDERRETLENKRIELQMELATAHILEPENKAKIRKLRNNLERVTMLLNEDEKEQFNSLPAIQVGTAEDNVNSSPFVSLKKIH